MCDRGRGSSVINNTLSLDTLANSIMSLNNNAQYVRIVLPSTLLKSPPNIHCLPGLLNTKGYRNSTSVYSDRSSIYTDFHNLTLHLVKTNLFSKSCTESNGRPSPRGSMSPASAVISRYIS